MVDNKEEVEIDLLELGKKLWSKKRFVIKCSIIGAVVAIVIAFSIPKEYTTTVVLTTGSGESGKGSMGALASMAGINLGGMQSEDVFSPDLYPSVLNSTPFIQGLLDINVRDDERGINTSLYEYISKDQKAPWWSYILKAPGALISIFSSNEDTGEASTNSNPRYIPQEEMSLIEAIKNSYKVATDKKTGITSIDVTSQSPKISAFLADTLTSYLQNYVIEQRTKKANTDLVNSEKLYEQSKKDYYKSQQNLAAFADANMNVISAKYKINQEKLQNEASIAYSVYNQMAQQVQMNKIKVQDNTPVFTIIQPAIEPLFAEKPKRKIIIIGLVFLSILGACSWILGKDYIQQLTNK